MQVWAIIATFGGLDGQGEGRSGPGGGGGVQEEGGCTHTGQAAPTYTKSNGH